MITVSLEAAQALKAAGFPQDRWPQMVYIYCGICDVPKANVIEWRTGAPFDYQHPQLSDKFLAAPEPFTALEWLENAKGIQWCKSIKQVGGEWRYVGWPSTEDFSCPTADALIIAICQR